ncbi:helix-turn-helix domain-containing protein [Mammaliicoccus sciuri]|uniref:helix-turn-helix domain-containing protein n=1 Tax=Mammaliicoccus sciuri TaxID=1296 RepID=UPI00289A39DD|nr:helix-turn-helix transcriptional regulator [Mammaliicoccus sciuri]
MLEQEKIDQWEKEAKDFTHSIAQALKHERKKQGVTQTQIERDLNYSRTWLSALENGNYKASTIKLENLYILSKYLNISIVDLMNKISNK